MFNNEIFGNLRTFLQERIKWMENDSYYTPKVNHCCLHQLLQKLDDSCWISNMPLLNIHTI